MERLWLIGTGVAIGMIFSAIFAIWGEAPLVYRVVYVVLFVGLLYAAMRSKPNTDKGSHEGELPKTTRQLLLKALPHPRREAAVARLRRSQHEEE